MINEIYINTIKQISVQKSLSDEWFDAPILYNEQYVRSIDADYKQYFTPNEARRLGKILKRALLVSREAMRESGVQNPGAIITGTGLGCIENTEIFLDKLVREGEELLNPTHFMQSTHNTISSLVAIDAKCHGYNSTYAHKGISFECALQDAFLQLKSAKIKTALVGAHDEMTPAYFTLLKKAGYLGNENQTFAGETAVAMMLSNEKKENTLCKIENVEKFYGNVGALRATPLRDVDYVMVGINGNPENDNIYFENCKKLFPNIPLLQYKNIFGESYTAPAFAVYAAAICLKNERISEHLLVGTKIFSLPRKILCYNHFEGKNHTFILLTKC
ncbi:3-oxoacyl-ACP synthase [Bacteroidia bacterium]|nr:3-oxoacyl-ACP synthase [Bacteroidia bacterium]